MLADGRYVWYAPWAVSPQSAACAARELRRRLARFLRLDVTDPGDPLDLLGVLEMLGLRVEYAPRLSNEYGAPVIGEFDRRCATVRVAESFGRRNQRFTIAHEIGHHQLHQGVVHHRDPPGSLLGMAVQRPPREIEANEFAAELLMPESSFTASFYALHGRQLVLNELTDTQLYRLGRLRTGEDIAKVEAERRGLHWLAEAAANLSDPLSGTKSLAEAFDVTPSAAAARLKSLGLVRLSGGPLSVRSSPALSPENDNEPSLDQGTTPRFHPSQSAPSRATQAPTKSVALLGEYAQQWRNRRALKDRGWTVLDYDSGDDIAQLRRRPPCAVLVHRSFWKPLVPDRREELLRQLAELSSFTIVRVELPFVPADVVLPVEAINGVLSAPDIGAFARVASIDLGDADFLALQRVLNIRDAAESLVLRGDVCLDDPTRNLLCLIAAEQVASETPAAVAIEGVASGHSGAKNFVLSVEAAQPTFAKTNDVPSVIAEFRRTLSFHRIVPAVPLPQVRVHGSVGALLQPFVCATKNVSTVPAPSLRDFLKIMLERQESRDLVVGSVVPAVLRTLSQLAHVRVDEAPRHLNMILSAYQADRARGAQWVNSQLPAQVIDRLAQDACASLIAYPHIAIVHGDAHLGNILLRGGTEPVIIDFAHAGPGHPLSDLVRFELGLWTALLENSERGGASDLVRALMERERVEIERLRRSLVRGFRPEMALRCSALVRETCRAVLANDPRWFEQYQRMHVLLALLALRSPDRHRLSEAVFSALAPCHLRRAV